MVSNQKRIAIVTGGASGIGEAIVSRLILENCFVISVDVDERKNQQRSDEAGKNCLRSYSADISDETQVTELFRTMTAEYGRVDVLVNNAGIIRDNMIWNMSLDDYEKVLDVNLKGPWLMSREAARIMKSQNTGRIINIVSRAWLGNRGQSNYSASKAGLVALTRVLALELGKYNVLVNAVAPGLINTPLTQKLDREVLDRLIAAQPTRSMGEPGDIANVVAFLSAPGTGFITGQTIYVDGGKSIGAGI